MFVCVSTLLFSVVKFLKEKHINPMLLTLSLPHYFFRNSPPEEGLKWTRGVLRGDKVPKVAVVVIFKQDFGK